MRKFSKSLTGALSEILILAILHRNSNYGYDIIKNLAEITNGKLDRQPASIYPLLRKMEQRGWIKSNWETGNERPRRVYAILKKGIEELETQKEEWSELINILGTSE
jgi:DNA-binding PadR family transcriptional regulator